MKRKRGGCGCVTSDEWTHVKSVIATGALAGPLTEAIHLRDAERQRLRGDLEAPNAVPALTRRNKEQLRDEVHELMTEWRGVLYGPTIATRQILQKLAAAIAAFRE